MIQIINPGRVPGRSSYGGTVLNFNSDGVAEIAQVSPGLERWLRAAGYDLVDLDSPEAKKNAIQFEPSNHTVEDVLEYLASASETERTRVLNLEADGKARRTILGAVEHGSEDNS